MSFPTRTPLPHTYTLRHPLPCPPPPAGLLRESGATILMATHQLHHLLRYDHVMVLEEGRLALQASRPPGP